MMIAKGEIVRFTAGGKTHTGEAIRFFTDRGTRHVLVKALDGLSYIMTVRGTDARRAVCQECGTPLGQRHGWGCDSVLHGDVALDNGQPPLVTLDDCKED